MKNEEIKKKSTNKKNPRTKFLDYLKLNLIKSRPTRQRSASCVWSREAAKTNVSAQLFAFKKKRKQAKMPFSPLVRVEGLEPSRSCPLRILSPVRLPFRHTRICHVISTSGQCFLIVLLHRTLSPMWLLTRKYKRLGKLSFILIIGSL